MEIQKNQQRTDLGEFIKARPKASLTTCIESTNINQLCKQYGQKPVEISIAGLIVQYMKMFNVKLAMSDTQIKFFAEAFMDEYGHETIDDVEYCLKQASMGKYGEIYSAIDPPTVFGWLNKHLDAKYQERERIEQKKKKEHLKREEAINYADKEVREYWSKKIREELKEKKEEKVQLEVARTKEKYLEFLQMNVGSMTYEQLQNLKKQFEMLSARPEEVYKDEMELLTEEIARRENKI